ncbi:outer membrane beta-barrel protein [Halofilum ochraceum]|uniref:outer membrane beta-barrel protein n=1 Tax=Halofilum ochraceum TaxID=1611323 RepID=UPI0008DABD42|nr:outer membrane beta-barrel protein [Halofilum ochraceum]
MKSSRITIAAVTLVLAAPTIANAAELEADRFYAGGGISTNDLHGEDSTGAQVFVGYELPFSLGQADTALEVGYQDAGDFDRPRRGFRGDENISGLWTTGVASLPVADNVDLVGRFGADFGDDDGLMAGGGVGIDLAPRVQLRGEYVIRDLTESLQANVLYRF